VGKNSNLIKFIYLRIIKNNTIYKTQEEWIGFEQVREYIFIIKDSSDIKDKLEEKEKLRAIFLVQLIEKYNYLEENIMLDVDVNNCCNYKVLRAKRAGSYNLTIDLLVYNQGKPFIAIDVNPEEPEQTITKAQELGAEYVAVVTKSNKQFFQISKTKKPISDLPKNT